MGLMLAEPGYQTRAFVEREDWPRAVLIAAQRAGYFAPAPIWTDLRSHRRSGRRAMRRYNRSRQSDEAAMTDGVIYVAEGSDYLDLAIRAARSLRALNVGLAVDLFTDQAVEPGLFDRVRPIPEGPTPKLASLPATRFDRTLYLDCDTLALAPLGDLFEILNRFELAVAHDVRRTSSLIREGAEEAPPYAFPQMNAGVILYRRSAAMLGFLREWQRRYGAAGKPRDQPTLRDLLWSSDLPFYVLPPEFNLRRVTVLDAWEPLDARPTILHSHRLLQHLRGAGVRLDRLDAILPEERAARAAEWRAAGLPDPAAGGDAVLPYLLAEAQEMAQAAAAE